MGDFESAIDYFHTVGDPFALLLATVLIIKCSSLIFLVSTSAIIICLQALGLKRDDTFSVTMLGHCIEMYIGDSDAYIGKLISLCIRQHLLLMLCTGVL